MEWEDAMRQSPEVKKAYPYVHLAPLLDLHDKMILIDDDAKLAPGLRAELTGGHTRGHLAFHLESDGQAALLIGDLCPTPAHLRRWP